MSEPAVFLDRDGTIIEDREYLRDPGQVTLLPGAANAIQRFAKAGFRVVLVSNQSGIARGLFDEATLSRVHARVEELLRREGAVLDGYYYCPYLAGAEAVIESYRRDSDCRKPNPGMLLQAAKEMRIDLARSWMIGDSASDVEAGRRAGCRTIQLVSSPQGASGGPTAATAVAATLKDAAGIIERGPIENTSSERITAAAGPTKHDERIALLLSGIHGLLERAQRLGRQHDFSVLRLFGALLQMLAIVSAIWGAAALLSDQAAASARLVLACFLQLASLSAFAMDRFR